MIDPNNATPIIPSIPPPSGTIDITNTVERMRVTFVTWGTTYLQGLIAALPYGIGPALSLPGIRAIIKWVIQLVLNGVSKSAVMGAFFLNTAVRKASQAQDYVDAVDAKEGLPPTATDAEYQKAEEAEMLTFRNFVMLTN